MSLAVSMGHGGLSTRLFGRLSTLFRELNLIFSIRWSALGMIAVSAWPNSNLGNHPITAWSARHPAQRKNVARQIMILDSQRKKLMQNWNERLSTGREERDIHFEATKTISEYAEKARELGRIEVC
jgi:Protein of unknown function (DUF2958)